MVGGKYFILWDNASTNITMTSSSPNPHLQLKKVVKNPPINGPTAAPTLATAVHIPIANARFFPLYVPVMMDAVAGVIRAAPIPSRIDHPIRSIVALILKAATVVPIP